MWGYDEYGRFCESIKVYGHKPYLVIYRIEPYPFTGWGWNPRNWVKVAWHRLSARVGIILWYLNMGWKNKKSRYCSSCFSPFEKCECVNNVLC